MSEHEKFLVTSRRQFAAALAASGALGPVLRAQQASPAQTIAGQPTGAPRRPPQPPEAMPFQAPLSFTRKDVQPQVQPYPMTQVRLGDGPLKDAQETNRKLLLRSPADRLLHNFRVNAGLPSSAKPLGGWELELAGRPNVLSELRGHYTGHYLSACALMYSSTGDKELKARGDYMVAELAKCQEKLGGGYLSAFPREFWERLDKGERVHVPFYTIHKIMAGMLDMYQHCDSKQAIEVLKGMSNWADEWTARHSEEHMQEILRVEYGGMAETLYSLAAITGEDRYAMVGDRFTKKSFVNPLALRRDELRGTHANTHIPQAIAAARRYEISGDMRFHDVADFFWYEVVQARTYVNGGTSNRENWLTEPRRLFAELRMATATCECCCAYNMLKLTRHLYQWNPDPRYFDYYEGTLFNHRLGTIHPETGGSLYFLNLNPGSWKTFSTDFDSCWCCTGSGLEEYSKLNDSIYFHDDQGVYVNLFIASDLNWAEKGVRIRQTTKFPEQQGTSLLIEAAKPVQMTLRIRVPWWATRGGAVRLNGKPLDGFASPGSYLVVSRVWQKGDRVDVELPMGLSTEAMPDDATIAAVRYGPIVLAGEMGRIDPNKEKMFGTQRPGEAPLPVLRADLAKPGSWLKPVPDRPLTFRTFGQSEDMTLTPLYKILDQRYTVYWKVLHTDGSV